MKTLSDNANHFRTCGLTLQKQIYRKNIKSEKNNNHSRKKGGDMLQNVSDHCL